ncbi:MAG: hypothetical protein HOO06_13270 [Bdellovibrionaceae bacterium]|nr:hypothetical protein [Pseudobdellovibrionaceae bacterium]
MNPFFISATMGVMYKYFFIFFILFFVLQILNISISSESTKRYTYVPPPKYLEHFSLGMNDVIADSLWLRWVQDMEVCGQPRKLKVKKKSIKKPISKATKKSIHKKVDKVRRSDDVIFSEVMSFSGQLDTCHKGWSFQLLDAVTTLSPKFKIAYITGATSLSVIAEDPVGAEIIFDKGIKQYPKDWVLHYRAAYHSLYEVKNFKKAARLLNKAGTLGGPEWVRSLASRLYVRTNQLYLGLITLKTYLKTVTDKERKENVLRRIQVIEAQIKKNGNGQ